MSKDLIKVELTKREIEFIIEIMCADYKRFGIAKKLIKKLDYCLEFNNLIKREF